MLRIDDAGRRRWALAGTCIVCAYLIAFRSYDLPHNYPLLGEQIRDWSIAQRAFFQLPALGPRSANSGLDIGPVYYWCLWALSTLSAPLFGVFPHVGGIAQAVFLTVSDGVLLLALALRLQSWWLAAVIVVFGATAPLDATLAGVTWNPPIAVAFVRLATAALLWPGPLSPWRAATVVVLAICATQCHASAIFVAAPIAAWTLWTTTRAHGVRGVTMVAIAAAIAIAPWALAYLQAPPLPTVTSDVSAASSVFSVVGDPFNRLRVRESVHGLSAAMAFGFAAPHDGGWVPWLLLAGAVALIVKARDGAILAVSVAPLLTAIAVFALWQGQFQAYWYLVVVPAAAICCGGLLVSARGRVRVYGTWLALAATFALQPSRGHYTWTSARLPAYGPLVAGVRAAAAQGTAVRDVEAAFDVPQGMDVRYLFSLAGGAIDHTAPVVLVIDRDGRARYRPAQP